MKKAINLFLVIGAFMLVNLLHAAETQAVEDVHTQSNFNDVHVTHMSLDLVLDMNKKFFEGLVDLRINNLKQAKELVLDSKKLKIKSVAISDGFKEHDLKSSQFRLGVEEKVRGQSLTIDIEPTTKIVRVIYETTAESTGLDFVDVKLTADKISGMMATQFQAINARTFVPCQDTPARRITYDAKIKLVSDVTDPRLQVIMAADIRKDPHDRIYEFEMTLPIPTYLIAMAAGVFEERKISHRVKVIGEPSMVDKAQAEFAAAERMMEAAEKLFGDYQWKRFDIFVMPPSFSYGGMENPTMTFIGPTVIAGDKSLTHVIAHELAHAWSGNWVTNENWNSFWINEGTTRYLERLIIAELYQEETLKLDVVLGQQVLRNDIEAINSRKDQGPDFTRLNLTMTHDFDPDDAVSHVPYEKGCNFWFALEHAYGRNNVIAFLKEYFEKHALSTMTSARLKKLIEAYLAFDGATKVDIEEWFYGRGIPKAGLPHFKSELVDKADEVINLLRTEAYKTVENFQLSSKQWSYVLQSLHSVAAERVQWLEHTFNLSKKNDEVAHNFYRLAIHSDSFKTYKEHIDNYLDRVGRVKYVKPIYEALNKKMMEKKANNFFEKHRHHNNHITNGAIARCLQ